MPEQKPAEIKPSLSRRDFLKGVAAGLAVGAIVGGGSVAALVPAREVIVERTVEKPTTVEKPVAVLQPTGVKRPTVFLTEFFTDIPRPTVIWRRHELCAGDDLCMVACSLAKEGRIWPEASRIRIFHFADQLEIIDLCAFCREWQDPTGAKTPPPCVTACPQGILKVSEKTGAIVVTDIGKCLGSKCGKCYEACPAKYPYFHPVTDKVLICDLCETRVDDPAKAGIPACVEACPNDALKLHSQTGWGSKPFSQPPEVFAVLIAKKWYGHVMKPEEVV